MYFEYNAMFILGLCFVLMNIFWVVLHLLNGMLWCGGYISNKHGYFLYGIGKALL